MGDSPKLKRLVAICDELLARLGERDDPEFDELKADIANLRERVVREDAPPNRPAA
jgi:hypothetical protein